MLKKILLNLSLIMTALSLALIVAEVFLHFSESADFRRPPQQLPDNVWREQLHRPSSVVGLAYELAPNRENYAHGIRIITNSFGMRDEEPHPKTDTSFTRIAVLGDSFTFGFGVPGEDTYPSVLERLLNKEIDARKFEVLNFGVSGYSTQDEALVFKHKVSDWDLNLVIIGYVFNDPEIEAIQPLQSHYQEVRWWQYSNLLRLVAKLKLRWDIKKYGDGNYTKYLHSANRRKWQSVVTSFEDIKRVADARNICVLLVIFPLIGDSLWGQKEPKNTQDRWWTDYPFLELHKQVAGMANEKDISVLDLYENFLRYSDKQLKVSPSDGHPSKIGHEVAAHAIYQWLMMNKEKLYFSRSGNSE